jgi:hypothetical protein
MYHFVGKAMILLYIQAEKYHRDDKWPRVNSYVDYALTKKNRKKRNEVH